MLQWISEAVETVVDFFTGGDSEGGANATPDPCDVGDCAATLEALRRARERVRYACTQLQIYLAPFRIAGWILGLPPAALVAILIFAALVGGLVGILIVVLVYLFALAVLSIMPYVIMPLVIQLTDAFTVETEALLAVQAECPPDCRGETSPSQCNLGEGNVLPATPFNASLGLDRVLDLLASLGSGSGRCDRGT